MIGLQTGTKVVLALHGRAPEAYSVVPYAPLSCTPSVERAQRPGHARPSHDAPGSELSVDDFLECVVHQRQVGIYALELGVLILQLAKLRQVRDRHARELAIPLAARQLVDAVPAKKSALYLGCAGKQTDLVFL